jgi:hypothetical protein
MTNLQSNKLDAFNRVDDFNTQNAGTLVNITEYAAEQLKFANALSGIYAAVKIQETAVKTKASEVDALKLEMAEIVFKFVNRAGVLAAQLNLTDLVSSLTNPISYIARASKTTALARASNLRDVLNNNLKSLTNIKAKDIAEIDKVIAAYTAKKDKPQINTQARKAAGTNPLPNLFKTATKAVEAMHKLVVSYYKTSDSTLVDGITLAKQINRTGIHHTGLQGIVTKNGEVDATATISIVATKKTATTDLSGAYSIIKVPAKVYIVMAVNKNGDKDSKTVTLKRGQIITVNFDLK